MALVEIENISKFYQTGEVQVKALRDVNLSIDEASFVSFVGPSGSGKTTILNLIGCLDKPTKGRIFVDGDEVNAFDRRQRAKFRGTTLGFIFQAFNLFPVLTTFENVEYPLVMIKNESSSKRREMVLKILESVGMLDQKDKFPDQISGGQNNGWQWRGHWLQAQNSYLQMSLRQTWIKGCLECYTSHAAYAR